MESHEPTIWAYITAMSFILIVAVIQLIFFTALFVTALFTVLILFAGTVRLCGHIIYSVTAICFGSDSRLCGLILELEQEELVYRMNRRRKALEVAQNQTTDVAVQEVDTTPVIVSVQ